MIKYTDGLIVYNDIIHMTIIEQRELKGIELYWKQNFCILLKIN